MSKLPNVFISYSHEDAEWAEAFARALEERGVSVWFDMFNISAGETISQRVEEGLRSSDLVVALVNTHSLHHPAFFFELGAAVALGKRLVGIVPKDMDPTLLPHSLRTRRYLPKDSPQETANALVSEAT